MAQTLISIYPLAGPLTQGGLYIKCSELLGYSESEIHFKDEKGVERYFMGLPFQIAVWPEGQEELFGER